MDTSDTAAAADKCRTLVVEDDRLSRETLVRVLRSTGHHTLVASTIAEAVERLRDGPECLILDLMLPDGMGTDVLRRVRAERLPIRVAIVTAVHHAEELPEIREHRPDAVFQKPLDVRRLVCWLDAQAA